MNNDEAEARARNRHFVLSALRFFGAVMVMAGFVLIMGKWELAGAEVDRIIGVVLVLVGMFDFAVAPVLLARSWKHENDR
jgi:drug/metabolite transporter (DMT)-like permease